MDRDPQGTDSYEGDQAKCDEGHSLSPNSLKAIITECLNNWVNYLQVLNTMCAAGSRLAQSLSSMSQMQNIQISGQCQSSWKELTKATLYASNTVKTHIAAAMQDMCIGNTFTESDGQRQQEHNQQIITENLLTFINLQYQFSIAGCECFGAMAMCPTCQATPGAIHDSDCQMSGLAQCFSHVPHCADARSQTSSPHFNSESPKDSLCRQSSPLNSCEQRDSSPFQDMHRGASPVHNFCATIETLKGPFPIPGQLHTMKAPFPGRGSRSPLHFPLFPLNCGQRRWSEAAAAEVDLETNDNTMRRWSMPWDHGRVETTGPWQQRYAPSKLIVPPQQSQDRSRSNTPEAVGQLGTITSGEGLAEAIQLLSCRPARQSIPQTAHSGHHPSNAIIGPWGEAHEDRLHKRIHPTLASQRGNWQSIDVPQHSGMSANEHYDIFPPVLPLTSRKSSSSTDSSSCLSIHSRSTTGSSERASECGGESVRVHTNLYSMWSGSEHLPFIRLPESQELQESTNDEQSSEMNSKFLVSKAI